LILKMEIKNLTKAEDCKKCIDCCCLFEKDDLNFAPIFTKNELKKIKEKYTYKFTARPYDIPKKAFIVNLIKSKKEKEMYVCPFFNEEGRFCKINDLKSLDCRLWPFILVKDGDRIILACFRKSFCPSIKKIRQKEFDEYSKYLTRILKKDKNIKFLKSFPVLNKNLFTEIFSVAKII